MNVMEREKQRAANRGGRKAPGQNGHDNGAQNSAESIDFVVDYILKTQGSEAAGAYIGKLIERLREEGAKVPPVVSTPYVNTIPPEAEPDYPGDLELERRIKSYIRWYAMAMVVNANRKDKTIGGHISTFASSATLYEVGYNHFFRGGDHGRRRRGPPKR